MEGSTVLAQGGIEAALVGSAHKLCKDLRIQKFVMEFPSSELPIWHSALGDFGASIGEFTWGSLLIQISQWPNNIKF